MKIILSVISFVLVNLSIPPAQAMEEIVVWGRVGNIRTINVFQESMYYALRETGYDRDYRAYDEVTVIGKRTKGIKNSGRQYTCATHSDCRSMERALFDYMEANGDPAYVQQLRFGAVWGEPYLIAVDVNRSGELIGTIYYGDEGDSGRVMEFLSRRRVRVTRDNGSTSTFNIGAL